MKYKDFYSKNELYFVRKSFRKKETLYKRRVKLISKLIMKDFENLCDYGCRDALFIEYLKSKKNHREKIMVGYDIIERNIEEVNKKKIPNASFFVKDIIKEDRVNEFDVVVCQELLEHIPAQYFDGCVKNLYLLARKQLILSSPYKEPKPKARVCPKDSEDCFITPSGHIHFGLTEKRFENLVPQELGDYEFKFYVLRNKRYKLRGKSRSWIHYVLVNFLLLFMRKQYSLVCVWNKLLEKEKNEALS